MSDSDLDFSAAELQEQMDAVVVGSHFNPDSCDVAYGGVGHSSAMAISTPLVTLIAKEEQLDQDLEVLGADEARRLRSELACLMLRELRGSLDRKPDLVDIGLNVASWCYEWNVEPFASMSMEQIGDLAGQGRAAIHERIKRKVLKKIARNGGKATSSPKHKASSLKQVFSVAQQNNRNRSRASAKEKLEALYPSKSKPKKRTKSHHGNQK